MDNFSGRASERSAQTYDIFQLFCEGADLVSNVWQPFLKSVGRWNLEVAGLGVKQTQATLQLSRDLATSRTPGDFASANLRYWQSITTQYAASSERLTATAARSVDQVYAGPPEVVVLPIKARDHDLIVIPDQERATTSAERDRKVA